MAGKHILVISQYFHPEEFRINDMCTEWVKRGYKVTVVTGIPNYPEGIFFEGYDKHTKKRETWNGIDIIRLNIHPRKHGSFHMALNYLSFVWSGFWWKTLTKIKADYVFCFEVSPMTQALVAVWYAKKCHIPCYLYVQDLWPDNVITVTGINNPLVIKPIERMVRYIYKHCTHIFGTSRDFVDEIRNKCPDKGRLPDGTLKVTYWPQYAEEFYKPVLRSEALSSCPEIPEDDSFKICFTGNIGKAQGLYILTTAAFILKKYNIKFIIVGDGREKEAFLESVKEQHVEDMFIFTGRKPAKDVPAYLSLCDAAFLSFEANALWMKTIPAKLQSYMACGKPIIAAAEGETKRIIYRAQCGLCSPIGDAIELSNNILKLYESREGLDELGSNARAYFEAHFSKKHLMDEIDTYFSV